MSESNTRTKTKKLNGSTHRRGRRKADSSNYIYESRYQQIAVELAEKIAEGWYQVGEKITARSTVATAFRVSPETARKAMQILVDMGIVKTKQGSGTYVASREKAQMFFEQYHSTVSISQTKQDLIAAIREQEEGFKKISSLMDDLIARTQRDHNTSYIHPHDMQIDEHCNFVGKTIGELNIWQLTGATIVAVRRGKDTIVSPGPYETIKIGDVLLFVGDDLSRQRMLNLFNSPAPDPKSLGESSK
jgi:K+/H+ antiporter YhaU regulatory subunit KhtT